MRHWFITGATGFIGQALIESILSRGDRITALRRSTSRFTHPSVDWVSTVHDLPDSVDVIVNLAGEGIADARWSAARRKLLIESRVTLTQDLAKVANQKQVAQVISASPLDFMEVPVKSTRTRHRVQALPPSCALIGRPLLLNLMRLPR